MLGLTRPRFTLKSSGVILALCCGLTVHGNLSIMSAVVVCESRKISDFRRFIRGCGDTAPKGERSENRTMEEKKNILTYAGLKKYEDELHNLKVVRRKEVAQKIKEAMEQGDLSENAEYDAAKDEQRDIEARIEELEKILKNVEVVTDEDVVLDRISVGCKVTVHDVEFDEDITYSIVGSTEANSLENKISNESPVGKALMGAKVGDVVKAESMAGEMAFKVLNIERAE